MSLYTDFRGEGSGTPRGQKLHDLAMKLADKIKNGKFRRLVNRYYRDGDQMGHVLAKFLIELGPHPSSADHIVVKTPLIRALREITVTMKDVLETEKDLWNFVWSEQSEHMRLTQPTVWVPRPDHFTRGYFTFGKANELSPDATLCVDALARTREIIVIIFPSETS